MADSTRLWRSLAIGALLGLLGVAGVGMWVVWISQSAAQPPQDLLVVALARDAEDAVVAGVVYVTTNSRDAGDPVFIDPDSTVRIPGTSYDTLKDAYAFGGGGSVLSAVSTLHADDSDVPAAPEAWLVLPDVVWRRLANEGGGVSVDVPTDINAFVGGRLYVFEAGTERADGDELFALASSIAFLENDRDAEELSQAVGEAIAGIVRDSWPQVVESVAVGESSSSVAESGLRAFAQSGSSE